MARKRSWNHTRLEMMQKCGLQYWWRYVEGVIAPPGIALLQGTVAHRTAEADLHHKRDKGKLLPLKQVEAICADAFDATWLGESPELDEDEKKLGAAKVKGAAKDQSLALARLHHDELAPQLEPIHLERQFILELPRHDYNVNGIADVQTKDALRDLKTSGKTPGDDAADKSTQLTIYALASRVLDKKLPGLLALDFLVKTKKPKLEIRTTTRGPEDFTRLFDLCERAERALRTGSFVPAPPDAWWCSKKYCGYFTRCAHGARRRTQT